MTQNTPSNEPRKKWNYPKKEELATEERIMKALRLIRAGIPVYLTEAAAVLGVSVHTVQRAIRRGQLIAGGLSDKNRKVRALEICKLVFGDLDAEPLDEVSLNEFARRIRGRQVMA